MPRHMLKYRYRTVPSRTGNVLYRYGTVYGIGTIPYRNVPAFMHAGLISTLQKVLRKAGFPTSTTLTENVGYAGGEDKTRPTDIMVLDYHAPGRHLLLDDVVTTVYMNIRQRETGEISGYAAKLVEDTNFTPTRPQNGSLPGSVVGCTLCSYLFALEDGGRLGAHAHAFLRSLAGRVFHHGRRSRSPACDPSGNILRSDGATHVSLWVQRWQRHISSWHHLSLSRQLLRLFSPQQAAKDFFS